MLKKVWVAPSHGGDMMSLTLESETVFPEYLRVKANEMVFPEEGDDKRHTINIGYLDFDDIVLIHNILGEFIYG